MTKQWWPLVIVVLAFVCSGCIVLALGAGAAGGYAISKDEIEGFSDRPLEKTWRVAMDVFNKEGAVESADKERFQVVALIDESKVTFSAEQVSAKSVRFRIQARKAMNLFPDIKLAQSLHQKIMKSLSSA